MSINIEIGYPCETNETEALESGIIASFYISMESGESFTRCFLDISDCG